MAVADLCVSVVVVEVGRLVRGIGVAVSGLNERQTVQRAWRNEL